MSRLRDLRVHAGLTQQQLANRAGLGLETVWRAERRARAPRPATMRKLLGALGLDVSRARDVWPVARARSVVDEFMAS